MGKSSATCNPKVVHTAFADTPKRMPPRLSNYMHDDLLMGKTADQLADVCIIINRRTDTHLLVLLIYFYWMFLFRYGQVIIKIRRVFLPYYKLIISTY